MNKGLHWAVRTHAHCTCESKYAYHTPGPMNNASDPMLRHILEWHKILYFILDTIIHTCTVIEVSRVDDIVKFKLPWVQMGIACDDFISVQADLLHCGCLAGSKTC